MSEVSKIVQQQAVTQKNDDKSLSIKKNVAYVASGVFSLMSVLTAAKMTALAITTVCFKSMLSNGLMLSGAAEAAEIMALTNGVFGPMVAAAFLVSTLFLILTISLAVISYRIGSHYSAQLNNQ